MVPAWVANHGRQRIAFHGTSMASLVWPVTSLPFMTCHTNPDGYQLDLLSLFWMVSHQIPANAPFMGPVWLASKNSQGWYQSGKLVTGHPWLFLLDSQSMPMNGALAGI